MSKIVNGRLVMSQSDLDFASQFLGAFQAHGYVGIRNLAKSFRLEEIAQVEIHVWLYTAQLVCNDSRCDESVFECLGLILTASFEFLSLG